MALSIDRLQHYTGTSAEMFQRYVLLTNYAWHVEEFRAVFPGSAGPETDGRQMPAWHHMQPDQAGLTMINIGVGPSNAKTITDHLAVLRPDLVLMIGHCGGLRNHQEIGDLVLATAFLRDDRVLDDVLPLSVPVVSNHTLNTLLLDELTARSLRCRMGLVFTTANRNWEFQLSSVAERLRLSRALAVDMESATVATNGFRYRIPNRHPARGQRQAAAWPPQAERGRSGLLRGHPPPARPDRDRDRGPGQAAVSRRAAGRRHPLP